MIPLSLTSLNICLLMDTLLLVEITFSWDSPIKTLLRHFSFIFKGNWLMEKKLQHEGANLNPFLKKLASRYLNKEKDQTWFMVSKIQIGQQAWKMETFSKRVLEVTRSSF